MTIFNFIDSSTGGDSGQEDVSDIVELVGDIRGAEGQDYEGASGGNGASIDMTLDVSGFDDIYWHVGGQPSGVAEGGANGGGSGPLLCDNYCGRGGGGASDLRVAADVTSTRIVVAGGGGGAGAVDGGDSYNGGDGGLLDGDDGEENLSFGGSSGPGGISENNGGGSVNEFEGE